MKGTKIAGLIILLLIVALVGLRFLRPTPPPQPPNVLVLMIDTLRADHLSMNGFERETSPVLDAFAARYANFDYTVAPSSWTPASVASLFTGLYPTAHGMMPPASREEALKRSSAVDERLDTMAEIFKRYGYRTAAVTPNPWMKEMFGFEQGFDEYYYHHRVRAAKINEQGIEVMERFRTEKEPFFVYLHYFDPHNPYDPPAEYRELFTGPLEARDYPEKMVNYIGLYNGEIRYVDDKLGELFEYLKQAGLYDDMVIVVVADHGEQFMEHGSHGHGHALYTEEVHVPMMIKMGQEGRNVKELTSLVDVLPTLVELIGGENLPKVQGVSLVPPVVERPAPGILSELVRRKGVKAFVTSDRKKLVLDYDPEDGLLIDPDKPPLAMRAYDTTQDYLEEQPLEDESLAAQLYEDFKKVYSATLNLQLDGEGRGVVIDEGTIKELESLGYL